MSVLQKSCSEQTVRDSSALEAAAGEGTSRAKRRALKVEGGPGPGSGRSPALPRRTRPPPKLGNLTAINSGQIDPAPANVGAVAWTYQAEKGKQVDCYKAERDIETLHNYWRGMSGEADLGLFGAIRILSSDVAVDPIFGPYCYGCDLTESGGCYTVRPRDGVKKRLNLITEKVYMELDRDQIRSATISKSRDYVAFTLENQYTSEAHATKVTLHGLVPGSFVATIDGTAAGAVTAKAGQPTVVSLPIGTKASYEVALSSNGAACGGQADGGGPADSGASGRDAGAGGQDGSGPGPEDSGEVGRTDAGAGAADASRDAGGASRDSGAADAGLSGSDAGAGAQDDGGAVEGAVLGACGCGAGGASGPGVLLMALSVLSAGARGPARRRD